MSPHPPPPHLTLENFNIESEVPEACPFVLTSPRSLEACRRTGVQPVSLLPTTLQEYEEALPDLPREKVLAIFREVETAKSGKLSLCREVRREIIAEEEEGEAGLRRQKLSCLSPIVEHVGGRDSALGTSHSSATTSQHTDSPEGDAAKPRTLLFSASNPPIFLTEPEDSDKPESDQHFSFPLIYEDDNHLAGDFSNLSHTSLESDTFYSDLVFSETPSPIGFLGSSRGEKTKVEDSQDWRSCPELDKDIGAGLADRTPTQFGNQDFPNTMEKNISRSAHSIKVSDKLIDSLSPTYRRTPSRSNKKKASRCERLTSESLQSLYDPQDCSDHGQKTQEEDDDVPESERFLNSSIDRNSRTQASPKSPWHHSKAVTSVSPGHSNLVRTALSRSDIDLDQVQISQQDLRILEILTIRNNAEQERKQKQHKLRIQWEEERCKRERAKTELEKEYRKQLSAKRRKENNDCQRRLEQARERLIKSQERLRQLLKEKDDRKKELIETLAKQKEVLLKEHREQEDNRRLAVDYAVNDLLARDTQYRNELDKQLQEKMKRAEKNKKLNENKKSLLILEARRQEALDHERRMKKLEELYEDHIEKIKKTIEKKIKQSQEFLSQQKMNQKALKNKNCEQYSRTLALRAELEGKLDLWRKQVLSVQSLSIRRAEEKVRSELDRRREKLAEEMRSREQKCLEKRKEKEKEKSQKRSETKKKIEEKDKKVEKLLNDREQSIMRARKMAETSAKLREIIKSFQ